MTTVRTPEEIEAKLLANRTIRPDAMSEEELAFRTGVQHGIRWALGRKNDDEALDVIDGEIPVAEQIEALEHDLGYVNRGLDDHRAGWKERETLRQRRDAITKEIAVLQAKLPREGGGT